MNSDDWISVHERLPEVGTYCLVTRRIRGSYWWFGCSEYHDFGFPFVMMDDPNPVTHWMPLPYPPMDDDNE